MRMNSRRKKQKEEGEEEEGNNANRFWVDNRPFFRVFWMFVCWIKRSCNDADVYLPMPLFVTLCSTLSPCLSAKATRIVWANFACGLSQIQETGNQCANVWRQAKSGYTEAKLGNNKLFLFIWRRSRVLWERDIARLRKYYYFY